MRVEGNISHWKVWLHDNITQGLIWMYSHTDLEANYKLPWLGFLKHCVET